MNPLQTIPNLPPAISLDGSEQVWINQAGIDRRTTVGALAAGAAQAGYLPLTGGVITGNLTVIGNMTGGGHIYAPTPPPGDNSTALATTAFVTEALADYLPLTGGTITGQFAVDQGTTLNGPLTVDSGASISGALSIGGFGYASTPVAGDSSSKLATTAFVEAAIAAGGGGPGPGPGYLPLTGGTLTGPLAINAPGSSYLSINDAAGTTRQVTFDTAGLPRWSLTTIGSPESGSNAGSDFAIYRYADNGASLGIVFSISRAAGSAAFSGNLNVQGNLQIGGTASGTTPAPGDNSTALATTAFVDAAIAAGLIPGSNALPLMDGTAAAGVASAWSRGDHVHPSDTSRAPASALANYLLLSGGTVSGNFTVTGVTALNGVSTAPTPAAADSSTNIATTAFVHSVVATGAFLPLTGGTLTGPLNINYGSAPSIVVAPASGDAQIELNKSAATHWNQIQGQMGGTLRWMMALGDAGAESGSNAGSDFAIFNYADNGSNIGNPLRISRSTGNATFSASISTTNGSFTAGAAVGTYRGLYLYTSSTARWYIGTDAAAESGSNAGSNLIINNFSDTGGGLGTPFSINRPTGNAAFGSALTVTGGITANAWIAATGNITTGGTLAGSYPPSGLDPNSHGYCVIGASLASTWWNAERAAVSAAQNSATFWISNGSIQINWSATASDRRLKSNLKAAGDALGFVKRLAVYDLDFNAGLKSTRPDMPDSVDEHWPFSLIADEVAEVMPHAAIQNPEDKYWVALHPTHLCAVLWKAVQQLTERLEAVEGKVAA